MKLLDSKLKFKNGKVKKEGAYKVHHVFKEQLPESLKKISEAKIFSGEAGQQHIDHSSKEIYIGLGEEKKFTNIRKLASSYIKLGEQLIKWKNIGLEIQVSKEMFEKIDVFSIVYHIICSLEIGAYPVNSLSKSYKDKQKEISTGEIGFVVEDSSAESTVKSAISKAVSVSKYVNGARYISHLPANHFTPEEFADTSKAIAKENNLKITVFDEARLTKEGFGGILSVCKGSDKSPKMIIIEYTPQNPITKEKLCIVGKGLTFDAGGISLKPSAEMHEMKYDMCGASTTIHAIGAIAKLGLRVPVIAAIGVAENMPDAAAIKPGDVYTAYNGLTVEVQNTDAEGRLVLGDVLSYVCKKYKPEYLVDLATLTGAVIVALGHEAAGVMSNSEELTGLLKQASLSSEDRIWELPLWEEFGQDLESDIADIRNITGGGRGAGTLSAAQFLGKFVEDGVKWAHIDVAGTSWRSKPSGTQCSGVTGYGVRLLVDLIENLEKTKK
ncbi:MAG: leucyl aminopeptidase [Leptospiraceae bacterium]|nr:leucyl aminopeptidase [Leptospiraceae bacterium]